MRKTGKEIDITQSSNDTSAESRSIRLVTKSNETPEGDGFTGTQVLPFTVHPVFRSFFTFR